MLSPLHNMHDSKHGSTERHVLVINDGKRRAIALDSAAYSMGRDESNAIVLDSPTISRKHAILLRLPTPGQNTYRYRLIDGDSEGNRSANGVFINEKRCTSEELVDGDRIGLGRKIKASYLIVSMGEAEFIRYLESTDFQSLKSDALNPKATLVASELEMSASSTARSQRERDPASILSHNHFGPGATDTLPEASAQEPSPVSHPQQTVIVENKSQLWLLAGTTLLILLAGVSGWYVLKDQGDKVQPPPLSAQNKGLL